MTTETISNFSAIVVDIGSGVTKAGFSGEDGPRNVFESVIGVPRMKGLLVGMEQKERYVGEDAISKYEIMNFHYPIKNGIIENWEKYETLLHYLFYSELKIVPEEINVMITETPLNPKKNREKQAEILFETFNVERIHIANSSMLGLYSYGKTSGLVLDSGFGVTSSVPIYEGYPLPHATQKINIAGEFLSETLLSMLKYHGISDKFKDIKGRLLADDVKEKFGYVAENFDDEEKRFLMNEAKEYTLPDKMKIKLGNEIYKHCEFLFRPQNLGYTSVQQLIKDSLDKCDKDILPEINENLCLIGGNTLIKGFPQRIQNEIASVSNNAIGAVNLSDERQFSSWIGGSIISSLNNFLPMWVNKNEYDEVGALEAINSKCFD